MNQERQDEQQQNPPDDAQQVGSRRDAAVDPPQPVKAMPGVVSRILGTPVSIGNALVLLVILGASVVGIVLAIGPTRDPSQIGINSAEYARGLITLIFSGGTMLIAVLLVLYVITSDSAVAKERFGHGKEVLTLLIGVFGTILGFYFGKSDVVPPAPAPTEQRIPADDTAKKLDNRQEFPLPHDFV